jgi:hypothetical protein
VYLVSLSGGWLFHGDGVEVVVQFLAELGSGGFSGSCGGVQARGGRIDLVWLLREKSGCCENGQDGCGRRCMM